MQRWGLWNCGNQSQREQEPAPSLGPTCKLNLSAFYFNRTKCDGARLLIALMAALCFAVTASSFAFAQDNFWSGADVSSITEIEKAGGIFRDQGKTGDALQILHDHGCNLFRVRLFVNPDREFSHNYGAVQSLDYVRALAKRIKATGASFLLDIHYSDTWADPGKQFTPAAWKDLDFAALEQQTHDYTASVLQDLQANGTPPDIVQVGNEITAGMLWPRGRIVYSPPETAEKVDAQWHKFARLFNAGARAVRAAQTDTHKIRIVLHIHGGGREGLPKWFFGKIAPLGVDYDIIGLSFYPAFDDSIDSLKQNMNDVIGAYGKDVLIAETSYPWKTMQAGRGNNVEKWPQTPEGQRQFLKDLKAVIQAAPGRHGIGFCWWYPEAIPVPKLNIWRNGAEALFDQNGNTLPALDVFSKANE
jgi:arabinogalactan endo-1,4-beta-galactosidase